LEYWYDQLVEAYGAGFFVATMGPMAGSNYADWITESRILDHSGGDICIRLCYE